MVVGWLLVGWLVGGWLLVVCLSSLGGRLKGSSERVLVASLVFVDGGSERVLVASLLWLWKGGWELVVACCGFVGGLLAPWLGGWVENLAFPQVFPGFWEVRLLTNLTLLCSPLPASRAVFIRFLVQNLQKPMSFYRFLKIWISTSPQELVYYVNKR